MPNPYLLTAAYLAWLADCWALAGCAWARPRPTVIYLAEWKAAHKREK